MQRDSSQTPHPQPAPSSPSATPPPSSVPPSAPPDAMMVVPADKTIMVTVIPATPTEETTVASVILGSLGVAGTLLMVALILGVALAAVRVVWIRRHPPTDNHLPPVTPAV